MILSIRWILIPVIFLIFPVRISAVTYFLSPAGSDNNPGTSTQPLKSLPEGIAVAADGDTLHFLPGTYDLNGYSTTISKTIHFQGDDQANTVLTNGRTMILKKAITVNSLTFSNFPGYVFQLSPGLNESIDGLNVENSKFSHVGGVFYATGYSGPIRNITASYNIMENINNSGITAAFRIRNADTLANQPQNITLIYNRINTIFSSNPAADVIAVFLGDDSDAANRSDLQMHQVTVAYNQIVNLKGGSQTSGTYTPGGRGILVYGTNISIDHNYVSDIIQNTSEPFPRNCIYLKGTNSAITNNVLHNCGSYAGAGSGDLTIKGDLSVNNRITDNHITSDSLQADGGYAIYSKGEVTIANNYVDKLSNSQSVGIYAYNADNVTDTQTINVIQNNLKVGAKAIYIAGPGITGTIAHNAITSLNTNPVTVPVNFTLTDNITCVGVNCSITPPITTCTNTGNYCISTCTVAPVTNYNSSCDTDLCCPEFSLLNITIAPSPAPTADAGKPGDANGDGKVDGVDYTAWLLNYHPDPGFSGGIPGGDFNEDTKVDGVDYTIWLLNYSP